LALELAMQTAPRTAWCPEPVYDHAGEWLPLAAIRKQLEDMAGGAKKEVITAALGWASTGVWPRLGNSPAFFLREAIHAAQGRYHTGAEPGEAPTTVSPPPWSVEETRWFTSATVEVWYEHELFCWAVGIAEEAFELQEESLPGSGR
jgi:hypothetical protein